MYDYDPASFRGQAWSRRRDEAGSFGLADSVTVDDPSNGRQCRADERRIRPIVEPPASDLVNVERQYLANPGAGVQLHRAAYNAYVAMKAAAERDGIPPRLLTIVSGYRSFARQRELWEQALRKYGTPAQARVWVAPPGGSAHNAGRAVDLWLGLNVTSRNVAAMRATPAYRWLVCNAGRFGFSPYAREPWHWEFNPPGFSQTAGHLQSSRNGPTAPNGGRSPSTGRRPRRLFPTAPAQAMGSTFYGEVPAAQPPGPAAAAAAIPGLTPAEGKALRITTHFETDHPLGFGGLTGNFDGQGLSFGMLQWNFGRGSLQPLLRSFAGRFRPQFDAIFGADAAQFRELLQPRHSVAEQLQFARSINDARNQIVEPWRSRFTRLANNPDFQQIQLDTVRPVLDAAKRDARRLCLHSERGLALMFDNATQSGPSWLGVVIGRTSTNPGTSRATLLQQRVAQQQTALGRVLTENELLAVIANLVADTSSARWREDVRRRRMTIVNGTGTVHGTNFDLGRQYGLSDQPWTPWTVEPGH